MAVGNTWTLNGTYANSGMTNSSGIVSDLYQNTVYTGGVLTQTNTTTTDGVMAAPTTSTYFVATDGSRMHVKGSTNLQSLPASFSVGSTWIVLPATATSTAVNGTILGVNVSCSSVNITFSDCLKISYTYTLSGTGTSSSTAYNYTAAVIETDYYSPSVGNIVQFNGIAAYIFTGAIVGSTTYTESEQLQAGYVAN
jgi:hypothetical protein